MVPFSFRRLLPPLEVLRRVDCTGGHVVVSAHHFFTNEARKVPLAPVDEREYGNGFKEIVESECCSMSIEVWC